MKKSLLLSAALAFCATAALAQPASHTYASTDQVKIMTPNGAYDNAVVSVEVNGAQCGSTLPTLGTGFGTGATVTGNGSCTFAVTIGTSPSATGVLTLPTATHGWSCQGSDITTNSTSVFLTKQTATSTTSCTVGNFSDVAVGGAWTAADVVIIEAQPY